MLRAVIPLSSAGIGADRKPSKSFDESVARLNAETQSITNGAADETNTQVLEQMIARLDRK